MKKKYCYRSVLAASSFVALAVALSPSALFAADVSKESPWEITADRMSRFENPASIVAEGNVIMFRKDEPGQGLEVMPAKGAPGTVQTAEEEGKASKLTTITGDWLRLDPETNLVKVRGHAVLDSAEEHITAESATLNLDSNTGVLNKATLYFPSRSLYVVGEHVEKTGELTYYFEDGWLTKCDPEEDKSPPWSYGWSKGYLTYEGFAHFTNATFRVKDIPVAYSPYFGFSTNRQRETGLLLPELSHGGRDGFGVLVPLFLNLSPSYDMTLYAGHLVERGNLAAAEARYVLSEESKGTFALNYLRDRHEDTLEDDFKSDGLLRTEKNRYWFRGKADHDFGFMLGRLDLDLVSDQDYLQEYQDGRIGFDESDKRFTNTFNRGFDAEATITRSNTAQFSKGWQDMSINSELRLVNDPTSVRSTSHLWTLPRIEFSGRKPLRKQTPGSKGVEELLESTDLIWDSEYVYYWRERGLGTQRLDMHPQLKVPLRFTPYVEVTATAGVQETLYNIDNNTDNNVLYEHGILSRTMYDYNISTSTILMRDFNVNFKSFDQLTHMIRPQVAYDYIPTNPQAAYPSFDATDRIAAKNLITYELLNDFDLSVRGSSWRTNSTRKLAYLKLKQSYDIREERKFLQGVNEKRLPFSAITTEFDIVPLDNLRFYYESELNVYGRGFTSYEMRTDLFAFGMSDISLEYRYAKDQAVNQLNGATHVELSDKVSLTGSFLHSFDIDKTSEASFGVLYQPACWAMEFLATTTADDDYRFTVVFQLEGIGKVFGINQTLYATDTQGLSFNKHRKYQ